MKKINLTAIVFAICCVSFLAFLAFNPSHAYFQSHAQATGVNTAKVDLLFDKFNADTDGNYTIGSFSGNINTDAWGTIKNPYVMTGKNHVNNLFILQRSGYFATKTTTVETTDAEGNVTKTEVPRQSYFVVSTKDGYPIAIDCGGMTINPIGSATNPFTGNIQGAPLTGEATYTAGTGTSATPYKVTQSTIANLQVVAVENTPDIGFFGTLGFKGTSVDYIPPDDNDADDITGTPGTLTGGFAASISNVLFADISISTTQSVANDWWTTLFKDHTHYTDHGETHHVGIVAGHAEWATIKDVSVYYSSDSIKAFSLGGTSTNYYSVCGIIGTLKYVNPTATSTGFNTENSVSDDTLELTGGGGGVSGMLTGYMLSEKIFGRNTNTGTGVGTENLEDIYDIGYDVKDLKEGTNSIFEYVDVKEKSGGLWGTGIGATETTYRYYFFRDSIFTFAMSARGQVVNGNVTDSDGKVDFLVRIWDVNDQGAIIAPTIEITSSLTSGTSGAWEQKPYPEKSQNLYRFEAVAPSEISKSGDEYLLVYRADDGNMYCFTLSETATNGYTTSSFTLDPIVVEGQTFAPTYKTSGTGYAAYDSSNNTYTIPKLTFNGDEVFRAAEGYLLYEGTYNNGAVTYNNSPLSVDTTGTLYFSKTDDGFFEAPYIWTRDEVIEGSNPEETETVSTLEALTLSTTVTENIGGSNVTYEKYKAVKVYMVLNSIYVADSAYYTTGTGTNLKYNYYCSKSLVYTSATYPMNTHQTTADPKHFGITASRYNSPSFTLSSNEAVLDSYRASEPAYWYALKPQSVTSNNITNLVSISGNVRLQSWVIVLGDTTYYYHGVQLFFDTATNKFVPKINSPSALQGVTSSSETAALPSKGATEVDNFLIFKMVKDDTELVPGNNWEVKDSSIVKSFDSSTHVLFYDGEKYDDDGNRIDSYTITSLDALKWNNGQGSYLTKLNHAVKLSQATEESLTLNFNKLLGDNWLGDIAQSLLGSNSGGLVPAEIGTNGTAYSIPAGMIAFDILKASADDPSYINIIVAVNPEQDKSWIGLYGPMSTDDWNDEFNLNSAWKQRFFLPYSKLGIYEGYLGQYATKISGYKTDAKTDKQTGDYYAYLGGEVAYVAYTFSVTSPGIYLLGSGSGPMTVAYFSVDGAAGAGNDGAGNLPLGFVDFVYDNGSETNPTILTVDKHQSGAHVVEAEDLNTYYYPSYRYVRLIPNANYSDTDTTDTINGKIPIEEIYVRRYIGTANADTGIKRHLSLKRKDGDTTFMIVSSIYADNPALTLTQ